MVQVLRSVYDAMIGHALEERQHECCGLLSGKDGLVSRIFRATNVAENKRVRYEAAPLDIARILNEIEDHLGNYLLTVTVINIGVGICTGIVWALTGMPNAAGLGALGQGKAVSSATEAIARNPGATGDIRGALLLGLVLIESLVIYVLLISLLLFFFNPFVK